MKHILIFSTAYLPLIGGAELALKELTDRMPDFEFDLLCARLKPDLPAKEKIGRVQVHRVGFGTAFDKWLLPVIGWWKTESLHRAKPYDLTWVMMASYASAPALFFKMRHQDVPMLLTLQEGDPPEHIARQVPPGAKRAFRSLFRRADALQTISRFLMDWGRSQGFEGKIAEIIPNGVNVAAFSKGLSSEERTRFRAAHGLAPDDFVIVTASRLVRKNGIDVLIRSLPLMQGEARRGYSGPKLLIAGEGELDDELKALAKSFGVHDRVVFAGTISQADLPTFLSASDVFCRPSRSEGFGTAFIEAMAAGLPVVATPVGGIVDFVKDGANGLLAKPEDAASVAEALRRLMDDPDLRARLSEGARTTAKEYDWDAVAQKMTSLFKRLCP